MVGSWWTIYCFTTHWSETKTIVRVCGIAFSIVFCLMAMLLPKTFWTVYWMRQSINVRFSCAVRIRRKQNRLYRLLYFHFYFIFFVYDLRLSTLVVYSSFVYLHAADITYIGLLIVNICIQIKRWIPLWKKMFFHCDFCRSLSITMVSIICIY